MGLFEKIFKRPRPQGQPEGFFKTLTAYTPAFTSWGGQLYESELVRAAINARATHISKLSGSGAGSGQTEAADQAARWAQRVADLGAVPLPAVHHPGCAEHGVCGAGTR